MAEYYNEESNYKIGARRIQCQQNTPENRGEKS